ncbi:hypothetical protein [Parasitella parasitica]|uniref:BRCT domain-containing protein n=1 Tax=Parasitella parasitica TaxID=35722 RepID=A0A0B7NEW1_9FUNG|nr:hypothetical protein [Parasitella parasitica]
MDSICKHDNYSFKSKIDIGKRMLKTKPKAKSKTKRKNIATAAASTKEEVDTSINDIDTDNLPNLLDNYVIYIHNSPNYHVLKAIAEGFGATVMSDISTSTTHVVVEPKGDPKLLKLVKQASSKRIICASPQWLLDCYEKKAYYSAIHYPYSMDKEVHILNLDSAEAPSIFDPFGTTYIDYDAQENRRANGGQTKLDGFITRAGADTPDSDFSDNLHNQDGIRAPFDSTAPYSSDELDEQEEMAREFYYNSNGEASTFAATISPSMKAEPETEEEVQERRKEAEERAFKAKQIIEQRMSRLEKEPSRSKKAIQSGFGERLRIWYGEQTVRQEDSRKRRIVQSVLGNQQHQRASSSSTSTRRQSAQQQMKRPRA